MTMATQPPASTWVVTGQMQTTQTGPTGQFQRGWNILYRTGLGHTGSVFVDDATYTNIALVKAAIAQAAANSDAIGTLTSES